MKRHSRGFALLKRAVVSGHSSSSQDKTYDEDNKNLALTTVNPSLHSSLVSPSMSIFRVSEIDNQQTEIEPGTTNIEISTRIPSTQNDQTGLFVVDEEVISSNIANNLLQTTVFVSNSHSSPVSPSLTTISNNDNDLNTRIFPELDDINPPSPTTVSILNHETGLFEDAVTELEVTSTTTDDFSEIKDKRKLNRTLRVYGKKYESVQKFEGLKLSVERPERKLKEVPCSHGSMSISSRSFLCGLVNTQARKNIFDYFWSLATWEAKRAYVNGLIMKRDIIKRRKVIVPSDEPPIRNFAIDCYLAKEDGIKVRVCREFFLATLGIGKDTFIEWLGSSKYMNSERAAKVLKHTVNPPTPKTLKSDSVSTWLNQLAKVPSHYCRSNTKRVYVDEALESFTKMHNVYTSWCQENNVPFVGRKAFCKVLDFNKISIFKPRKDQCDLCVQFKQGNLPEQDYEIHIKKKTEAREAKKQAILNCSDKRLVVTMDLQSVQLCPKLLVSAQYYKQKLQVHSFTIYMNNTKDVVVYVWHEGDGGVTANEFVTCIVNFLTTQISKGYEHITIISDGCMYQNKNKVLCSALADITNAYPNTEIEQLILEKGHTMMEVDCVHSTLEKSFKPPIHTPSDYVNRIMCARPSQPYITHYLDFTFFKNYEEVPSNFSPIRPGKRPGDPTVADIRAVQYRNGDVFFKISHTDAWNLLPQRRNADAYTPPETLYTEPRKIEKSKYEQLQTLKPFIHRDYHSFYDNLSRK